MPSRQLYIISRWPGVWKGRYNRRLLISLAWSIKLMWCWAVDLFPSLVLRAHRSIRSVCVLVCPPAIETSPSEPIGPAQCIWRAAESQSRPGDRVLSCSLLGKNLIWGRKNEHRTMLQPWALHWCFTTHLSVTYKCLSFMGSPEPQLILCETWRYIQDCYYNISQGLPIYKFTHMEILHLPFNLH